MGEATAVDGRGRRRGRARPRASRLLAGGRGRLNSRPQALEERLGHVDDLGRLAALGPCWIPEHREAVRAGDGDALRPGGSELLVARGDDARLLLLDLVEAVATPPPQQNGRAPLARRRGALRPRWRAIGSAPPHADAWRVRRSRAPPGRSAAAQAQSPGPAPAPGSPGPSCPAVASSPAVAGGFLPTPGASGSGRPR